MSDLTVEKIREMMRSLPPAPHNDLFDSVFPQRRVFGMPMYEAPPPPPKIQVRDIKFADGTSILTEAFRVEMNRWLLDRFGYAEDMFKDKIYIFGGQALLAKPEYCAILRNFPP